MTLTKAAKQLPQRAECTSSQFHRAKRRCRPDITGKERSKYWKHSDEQCEVAWQQSLNMIVRETAKVLTDVINQVVERLIRYRLTLITAPGKNENESILLRRVMNSRSNAVLPIPEGPQR